MADDTGSVLVGAYAVWFHPTPDAGVVIISRKAVDKMKVLLAHREIQAVRQAGEKTQDTVSFFGGAVVEQFPVGSHTSVLPSQIPGADFIIGA